MITLLNTSIITCYGQFKYEPITLDSAKARVQETDCSCYGQHPCLYCGSTGIHKPVWQSAIGHESTAEILSELLEVPVPVNRLNYEQTVGESAVVFKLKQRAPEGKILSKKEIEKIGYEFGLLTRVL